MPITIEKIDTWIVEAPTIRPHVLAMTSIDYQVMAIVFLHCSDGTMGVGEGTTIGGLAYGEESPEGIKLAIEKYFSPLLIGADAEHPRSLMALLDKHIVRNHFAKNAIETALLDAASRRSNVSLSTMLGGRLREELPVLWTLASGNTAIDIDEAERMLAEQRHNTFKLKIGKRTLKDDVAHVAAIKRALGDRASVTVDINQAWDEQTAVRGAQMLADAGVDLIEQPLPRADRCGMQRLTGRSPIPIMADEALQGPHDAFALARQGCANIFSIKPPQAGGLIAARNVAVIADAAHIGIYGGTMLDGSVGTAAAAHLFATLPNLQWGTELFGPLLQSEELLQEPLSYRNYGLEVPTGPGLGIELDMDKLRHFRRDAPSRTVTLMTGKESA